MAEHKIFLDELHVCYEHLFSLNMYNDVIGTTNYSALLGCTRK